jgi:hypothetical protein
MISLIVEAACIVLGILLAHLLELAGVRLSGDWRIGLILICIFFVRLVLGGVGDVDWRSWFKRPKPTETPPV